MKSLKYCILFFSLLCLLSNANTLQAEPFVIDNNINRKSIGPYLEFIPDKTGKMEITDIIAADKPGELKWQKSKKEKLAFGFTEDAYWVRFTVTNSTNHELKWYLEQNYPMIDYIELYVPDKKGLYVKKITGDRYPFSQREVKYRTFIFPLKIYPKKTETYYARFQTSSSLNIIFNVWTPEGFHEHWRKEAIYYWMFYGILFVMLIYNLMLFFSIRDLSYLYCIVYILSLGVLLMTLYGHGFQYLWPNWIWWANVSSPVSLGVGGLFIILFLSEYQGIRNYSKLINIFHMVFVFIHASIVLFVVIFGNIRAGTTAVTIVYIIMIPYLSINGYYLIFKYKSRESVLSQITFSLLAIGGILYAFKSFGILPSIFITDYGIHLGIFMNVVLLSFALSDKINVMKKKVEKSEKKYKHLVEGSEDIIFSLNEDFQFLSVNAAVKKHLGFSVEALIGTNFLDLIQESWSDRINIARQIVIENLSDLMQNKTNTSFRTTFKIKYGFEPKELVVKMEYSGDQELEYKILGKASPIIDDTLMPYLKKEEFTYDIDNYLNKADLMGLRLTRNLEKFINITEINAIRFALRESIINAIEHGNLHINFQEKTEMLNNDEFHKIIRVRQKDPEFREKRVTIEYSLNEERVIYIISDEGKGFDYDAIMEICTPDPEKEMLFHGRGLIMINATFDKVEVNETGNKITLIKYFKDYS